MDTTDHTATLPVEMLREIFKTTFDSTLRDYEHDIRQSNFPNIPLILGSVASRWRGITLEMPLLWTFIQLDIKKYLPQGTQVANENHLTEYIARSQDFPLRLAINRASSECINSSKYPISVIPSTRITAFYFRLDQGIFSPDSLLMDVSLDFPCVESLDFIGVTWDSWPEASLLRAIFQTPDLRSLQFGALRIRRLTPGTLHKLESLKFVDMMVERSTRLGPLERLHSLNLRNAEVINKCIDPNMRLREIRLEDCPESQFIEAFQGDTSLLTRMTITAIPLGIGPSTRSRPKIERVVRLKGSTLTSLELVDVLWRPVGKLLEHLVSLEDLHMEESGADHERVKAVNRGKIDDILDALPGLEDRLPSLSRIYIKSHVLVDHKGLMLFFSRLAGAKKFQLQILSPNFTEDLPLPVAFAHIDLVE